MQQPKFWFIICLVWNEDKERIQAQMCSGALRGCWQSKRVQYCSANLTQNLAPKEFIIYSQAAVS